MTIGLERWVYCRKCGEVSRKRGRWDFGCPREGCDGGPDDITLTDLPCTVRTVSDA